MIDTIFLILLVCTLLVIRCHGSERGCGYGCWQLTHNLTLSVMNEGMSARSVEKEPAVEEFRDRRTTRDRMRCDHIRNRM